MKIGPFSCVASSAEFGAGDGGGDGHVETLGTLALMEVGYEQPVGDALAHGLGDAVALVAHDDDATVGQRLLVDVVAIEQGSVNGEVAWQRIEKLQEVTI